MSLGGALALVVWSAVMFLSGGFLHHCATRRGLERLLASRPHPSNPAWDPETTDLMQQRAKDFYQ